MKEILFKKQNNLNRGFTLVETLVAVSIFTVSLLALISLLASGISDTNYAKQKLTASYLAQEGVEYLRNLRDNEVLYNPTSGDAGWTVFKNIANLNPTYPSPDPKFTREININVLNGDEVSISSSVSWMQGSGSYTITFSEHLFNWYQ